MSKRKVVVTIGNLEDMAREAIDVWHQAETGKIPKNAPVEKIYFENRIYYQYLPKKQIVLLHT
jgi:hypothetical protein